MSISREWGFDVSVFTIVRNVRSLCTKSRLNRSIDGIMLLCSCSWGNWSSRVQACDESEWRGRTLGRFCNHHLHVITTWALTLNVYKGSSSHVFKDTCDCTQGLVHRERLVFQCSQMEYINLNRIPNTHHHHICSNVDVGWHLRMIITWTLKSRRDGIVR